MTSTLTDADGWRARLDQLEAIALDTHAKERSWYLEDGKPSRGTYAYHLRQRELRLASEEADLAYELARQQSGLWKSEQALKAMRGRIRVLTGIVKRLRAEIAVLRAENGEELIPVQPIDARLSEYLAVLSEIDEDSD